jgi:hypothetical protein
MPVGPPGTSCPSASGGNSVVDPDARPVLHPSSPRDWDVRRESNTGGHVPPSGSRRWRDRDGVGDASIHPPFPILLK